MVDKQVVYESLGSFLKAVKGANHGWVFPDSVQASTDKRVTVEGIDITVYINHVYPIESSHDKAVTGIDINYGDFNNFKNFLKAHKPDKLYWRTYPDNSSDWLKKRRLGLETVVIESVKRKGDRFERDPFNYFQADKVFDLNEYRNDMFKMIRSGQFKNYKDRL